MLSFTHDQRQKQQNNNKLSDKAYQQYHPLIIKNTGIKNDKFIQPIKQKKKLIKTHSNSKKNISQQKNSYHQHQSLHQIPWTSQPGVNGNTGTFDTKLKKNQLANQERRLKAQSKTKSHAGGQGKQLERKNSKILTKQQEIHRKKMAMLSQQQQKQIQKLKKLIEKQRQQKQKNDKAYEIKKKQIEAQRKQLIELQKQIQKQGPKAIKQINQKIGSSLKPNEQHERVKLKGPLDQSNPKKAKAHPAYNEITQSESIANQKHKIRQQQLEYLIDQRQKNFKQYQQNTLGYTPTLIPLLSRASYKIISTQVSTLVQLLIDDLLQQQVYLLQAIQLQEKLQKQKIQQQHIIQDYLQKLQDLVDQNDQIQGKVGKYNQMKFYSIYKPKFMEQIHQQTPFLYSNTSYNNLQLNLSNDRLIEMNQRIDRYKKYINIFDEYKIDNLQMFKNLTQQVINQSIQKIGIELDNGVGQFVNIVFRSQFE